MTTQEFTSEVKTVAESLPALGRFGRKAWIHAVFSWGRFSDKGFTLDTFKAALFSASQVGLVELARCDMTQAFDAHDVKRSNFSPMGVTGPTFNFVVL